MALKAIINNLEEVSEALRSEYKPDGAGKFVLDTNVEEHPGLTALKNSLTNAREERNRAKEDLLKFHGIDPEKYAQLQAQERQVAEGKLIAEGKVEDLVALRTQALREDLSSKVTTAEQRSAKLQQDMDRLVIDNAVHAAASKLGVRKSAVDDVLARARGVFRAQDGQAVAFKGESPMYGKDGVGLLGIEEWLGGLPALAPHLFEDSKGGGALGGARTPTPVAGPGTISRGDTSGFLQNLDKIAKGQVKVIT